MALATSLFSKLVSKLTTSISDKRLWTPTYRRPLLTMSLRVSHAYFDSISRSPCSLSHYSLIMRILLVPPFMHGTAFSLLPITTYPFYPPPFKASIYKSHYIPPNAFIFTPNHLCISLPHCPGTLLCAFLFVHLIMAPSDTHMSLPASPFRCSHCIASFYVCISLQPIL